MLPQPAGLLKLVLNLFRGGEPLLCDLLKYTFYIGLCRNACEPIYLKLGIALGTTILCSFISV